MSATPKMLERILGMLTKADTAGNVFPPTELYSEGWMLRLLMSLAEEGLPSLPFRLAERSIWYSEALLPSPFLPRFRGDTLAESLTHADGVVGHFRMRPESKAGLELLTGAKQFIVLEAKMYSQLSKGTTHAKFYDQAARNVACMAQAMHLAHLPPIGMELGFYVLAPESQIRNGEFGEELQKEHVEKQVRKRIGLYQDDKTRYKYLEGWLESAFLPLLDAITIKPCPWEELIDLVEKEQPGLGDELQMFYERCKRYNVKAKTDRYRGAHD